MDVGDGRLAPSIAHEGTLMLRAVIGAGTAEGEAESAGKRGFGVSGIRRRVLAGVAPHRLQCIRGRAAFTEKGRGDDEECREPGSGEIDQIVELRRGSAEIAV